MKSCDICGTLNFKENKYCTHCGNKFIIENICPFCGAVNNNSSNYCTKCGKQMNPIIIDDFDILFSEFNRNLLENAQIDDVEYNMLLSDIFLRLDYIDICGKTTKDKIKNLANVFAISKPKSRGYERGFTHLGTYIYYDDRLDESVQIATIIHELAHYLLFNIIEELLCEVFKIKSSLTLQSFILYFLTLPEFKIMNEYCAHTVEGRFIPYGYQNYGSFNMLVEEYNFGEEELNTMVVLGNSFANEIIIYLEKYIDDSLREEIKLQYRKDFKTPTYDSIIRETTASFELSKKNDMILKLLYSVFISCDASMVMDLENIRDGMKFERAFNKK